MKEKNAPINLELRQSQFNEDSNARDKSSFFIIFERRKSICS